MYLQGSSSCFVANVLDRVILSELVTQVFSLTVHADCLAFVPEGQCSMANLRPKGPRLRLCHLRMGELHH